MDSTAQPAPGSFPYGNAIGPIIWVLDDSELGYLIEACRSASEVIVDLETTGLEEFATTGGRSNGGVAARIALAAFTLPQAGPDGRWDGTVPRTYVLPLSHPDSPWSGRWRRVMRQVMVEGVVETSRPVNNQNVKFDARYLSATVGVDISHLITWDPSVASHLLDETISTRLKERVPIEFEDEKVHRWDDFDLSTPGAAERVPLIQLGEYAARDTWWNWRLSQRQRERMFLQGGGYPEPVYDVEPEGREEFQDARLGKLATYVAMPTVASLTKMEQNGLRLDIPWTVARLNEESAKRDTGLQRLREISFELGMRDAPWVDREPSTAANALWFKELMRRAVDARLVRVESLTAGSGAPQWDKHVLRRQARTGSELASVILEEREGEKRAQFLNSWLVNTRSDGKIHATYRVGWVRTGRLSSADPNMQQVTKALRPAFIASDDDHVIADFDFSQLELRVAAFVARCVPMIEAFHRGEDLHKLLGQTIVNMGNAATNRRAQALLNSRETLTEADKAFLRTYTPLPESVPITEVTDYQRQKAKSANFGLLYMQGPVGFRDYAENNYGVEMTLEEAVAIHSAFFEQWTGMHAWHEQTKLFVRRHGYIESPIGRVRRLPNIDSPIEYLRSEAERQAVNSPVQGTGSDLMQIAAADIQGLLPGTRPVPGVRLVGTVHDSLLAELPRRNWEEPANEIKRRMERAGEWFKRLGVDFDVPLVADVTVGTRWSQNDISDPEDWAKKHPEETAA